MNEDRSLELIESYGLPPDAEAYLKACVQCGPSRSVLQSCGRSIVGYHYSKKLQGTRQFESRSGEAATMILLDADPSVLSYYSQIAPVEIPCKNKRGRAYVKTYTPDLLVLREDRPTILEVKPWPQIERLAKKESHHWELMPPDGAVFRPADSYFSRLGIQFEVFNISKLSWIFISNVKTLLTVLNQSDPPPLNEEKRYRAAFDDEAWMSISALSQKLDLQSLEPIVYMIARGIVFADLEKQRLCEPSTLISADPALLVEGLKKDLAVDSPSPTGQRVPTAKEAQKALANLELAKFGKSRQARRLRQQIREGRELGKTDFESVRPQYAERGNRDSRLSKVQRERAKKHMEDNLLTGKFENVHRAFIDYRAHVRDSGCIYEAISETTYKNMALDLDPSAIAGALRGRKAANNAKRSTSSEHANPRATRAFERALVDHSLLDLYLVVAENSDSYVVRRPWLSSLIDEYSGVVLSQWLSFGDPSTEAICMLLRLCVLAHSRVPSEIHSDRGSDFTSIHSGHAMSALQVSRSFAPAASPKYNSAAERYFAELQSALLTDLPGNMIEYSPRSVESSHSPAARAKYRPSEFYDLLFQYKEIRNNGLHSDNSRSNQKTLESSLSDFPSSGNQLSLTDEIYYATCIPVTTKWKPTTRGSLLIDGRHYYSEAIRPDLKKKDLSALLDPWDSESIYVQIRGKIHKASTLRRKTRIEGLSYARRFGEALRIRMCRSERDKMKSLQNEELGRILRQAEDSLMLSRSIEEQRDPLPFVGKAESIQQSLSETVSSSELPNVEWD